jgi:hypothetical protein
MQVIAPMSICVRCAKRGAMIPESLVSFLESGISVLVGSANERHMPSCARAAGAIVSADRARLTVLIPKIPGEDVLADLEKIRRGAVMFSRAIDHRTLQLKGSVVRVRPANSDEVSHAIAYRRAFAEMLQHVGLPRALTESMAIEPCVAVELEVDEIFRQTPGPEAGERLARGVEA